MEKSEHVAPGERTLPALLNRAASRHGTRPLLRIPGGAWRHCDAPECVARRAGALAAAGIARGDRVAILCTNRLENLEVFLACGWMGAVAVPINTAAMGPQIDYYLANSGARLLVVEERFVDRLQARPERVWTIGRDDPPAGEAMAPAEMQPGDTLAILYTSGTTGPAKGVIVPHAQYYWWGRNTAEILGVRAGDVLGTTLPLSHINALNTFAQALVTGAAVAYEARFSASDFWPAMTRSGATVGYLLGAMVPILLAQPVRDAERSHRMRVALGPGVPRLAAEAFHARTGVALLDGYGSTETNFVIAATPGDETRGSLGRARPGFHARVVDEHDTELPAGEAGELVLRADEPFAFASGYFGMPEKTVEAWRNLWFHTGDRVVREADGSFRFVDRIKDAIRRRGENISSWEVEQVLLSFPGVAQAAVYPVPSELAEDEVMAAVVPREGEALEPAALARHCEGRLPRFAIPRYIEVMADLPRTENGKVQKWKLKSRGVGPATWDRAQDGTSPSTTAR